MTPYYQDECVTLYHGDCREVDAWLGADVLVTDPPYGRAWKQGGGLASADGKYAASSIAHGGIANDDTTATRDAMLAMWDGLAIVFGDPLIAQPPGAVQALAYIKPADAGVRGARAGFRRDVEMIYLVGPWPSAVGGRTSALTTNRMVAGSGGIAALSGHPHAKPIDLLEALIEPTSGTIADPFAGSGSTLVAAKRLGRKAIGVELDERYCEIAARRLSQGVLDFGRAS